MEAKMLKETLAKIAEEFRYLRKDTELQAIAWKLEKIERDVRDLITDLTMEE